MSVSEKFSTSTTISPHPIPFRTPRVHYQSLTLSSSPLPKADVHNQPLVVHVQVLLVRHRPLKANNQPVIVHNQLPLAHNQTLIATNQPLMASNQLLIAHDHPLTANIPTIVFPPLTPNCIYEAILSAPRRRRARSMAQQLCR